MNLSSLTAYITGKMEQTDVASVAFCNLAINARYQQIWDSQPWRDTLCLVSSRQFSIPTQTVNYVNQTGATTAGTSFAIFPSDMERVLSVRLDPNTVLHPSDLVTVMDYNSEIFNESGAPIGFSVMQPIILGPLVDGSTSGFGISQPFPYNEPDIGLKYYVTYECIDGSVNTYNSAFVGNNNEPLILFANGSVTAIHSFSCDPLSQPYMLTFGGSLLVTPPPFPGIQSVFLNIGQTSIPRCPRIRLLQTPQSNGTLLSICKRRFQPLAGPSDVPILTNAENCIIAFAQADMLERNRQYAKAQAKMQEAQAQMQIMADLERQQTASTTRIIPADIHGDFMIGGFGSYGKEYW